MEKGTRKGILAERNEKEVYGWPCDKKRGERRERRGEKVRRREKGRKTRRPYRDEYVEEEEEEENGPCAARTPRYRQGVS